MIHWNVLKSCFYVSMILYRLKKILSIHLPPQKKTNQTNQKKTKSASQQEDQYWLWVVCCEELRKTQKMCEVRCLEACDKAVVILILKVKVLGLDFICIIYPQYKFFRKKRKKKEKTKKKANYHGIPCQLYYFPFAGSLETLIVLVLNWTFLPSLLLTRILDFFFSKGK